MNSFRLHKNSIKTLSKFTYQQRRYLNRRSKFFHLNKLSRERITRNVSARLSGSDGNGHHFIEPSCCCRACSVFPPNGKNYYEKLNANKPKRICCIRTVRRYYLDFTEENVCIIRCFGRVTQQPLCGRRRLAEPKLTQPNVVRAYTRRRHSHGRSRDCN